MGLQSPRVRPEKNIMQDHALLNHADQSRKRKFEFTAPDATVVQLVGDFTRWTQQPIDLRKSENGVWEITVNLRCGIHFYRFLVDGTWRDDPKAILRVANRFGTFDSVTHID